MELKGGSLRIVAALLCFCFHFHIFLPREGRVGCKIATYPTKPNSCVLAVLSGGLSCS